MKSPTAFTRSSWCPKRPAALGRRAGGRRRGLWRAVCSFVSTARAALAPTIDPLGKIGQTTTGRGVHALPAPPRSAPATTSARVGLAPPRDRGPRPRRAQACTKAAPPAAAAPAGHPDAQGRAERLGQTVHKGLCEHFPSRGRSYSTSSRSSADQDLRRAASPGTARGLAATSASRPWPRSWPPAGTSTSWRRITPGSRTPTTIPGQHPEGRHSTRSIPRVPGGEMTPEDLIARAPSPRSTASTPRSPAASDRHVRRGGPPAPRHLARAGRRRLRVAATPMARRCARSTAAWEHLVPLRRAGLGRPRRPVELRYRGSARRTSSSRRCPAAPASAPRPRARTSASSPPRRAGTCTSAATAA